MQQGSLFSKHPALEEYSWLRCWDCDGSESKEVHRRGPSLSLFSRIIVRRRKPEQDVKIGKQHSLTPFTFSNLFLTLSCYFSLFHTHLDAPPPTTTTTTIIIIIIIIIITTTTISSVTNHSWWSEQCNPIAQLGTGSGGWLLGCHHRQRSKPRQSPDIATVRASVVYFESWWTVFYRRNGFRSRTRANQ